ncbi:MAG TPA: hypothetical protein ENN84_02955 [Candidatus Marinimicrobia bacterium]|nr:hypothetical protein [Candidatus Neomarinimicrobiota bacterium]
MLKFQKFLILLIWIAPLLSAQKMAVSTKFGGDVQVKKYDVDTFIPIKSTVTIFHNGDIIRTGEDAFITVVFLDDKSQVKLWEKCELTIQGTKDGKGLSKNLTMDFGQLKAEVNPQRKGEFRIATPVSVMGVKGTDFWIISDAATGDKLIGLTGAVELTNNLTRISVTVTANQTGISKADGTLDVFETKREDLESLPEDDIDDTEEGHEIRIPFINSQGESKILIIEY